MTFSFVQKTLQLFALERAKGDKRLRQRCVELLHRHDQDGNGKLDHDELKSMMYESYRCHAADHTPPPSYRCSAAAHTPPPSYRCSAAVPTPPPSYHCHDRTTRSPQHTQPLRGTPRGAPRSDCGLVLVCDLVAGTSSRWRRTQMRSNGLTLSSSASRSDSARCRSCTARRSTRPWVRSLPRTRPRALPSPPRESRSGSWHSIS